METDKQYDTWHGRRHRRRPPLRDTTFDPPDDLTSVGDKGRRSGMERATNRRVEDEQKEGGVHYKASCHSRRNYLREYMEKYSDMGMHVDHHGTVTMATSHPSDSGYAVVGTRARTRRNSEQDSKSCVSAVSSTVSGAGSAVSSTGKRSSIECGTFSHRLSKSASEDWDRSLQSYLQTDSVKPRGRRSMSDLGLAKVKFGSRTISRTAALLQNPAINRHITKMMGLSENDERVVDTFDDTFKYVHGLPGKTLVPDPSPALHTSLTFEPGTLHQMSDSESPDQSMRRSVRHRPRSCSLEIEKDWADGNCPRCVQDKLRPSAQTLNMPCTLCGTRSQSQVSIQSHDQSGQSQSIKQSCDHNGQSQTNTQSGDQTDQSQTSVLSHDHTQMSGQSHDQEPDLGAFSRSSTLRASTNSLPQISGGRYSTFTIPSYQEFKRMRHSSKEAEPLPSCIEESPLEGEEGRTPTSINFTLEITRPEEELVETNVSHPVMVAALLGQSKSEPNLRSLQDDPSDAEDLSSSNSSLQTDSSDSSHIYENSSAYIPSAPNQNSTECVPLDIKATSQDVVHVTAPKLKSKHTVSDRTMSTSDIRNTTHDITIKDTTDITENTTDNGASLPPRPEPPKRSRRVLKPTPSLSPKPSRKAHTDSKIKQFCDKTFDEDQSMTSDSVCSSDSHRKSTSESSGSKGESSGQTKEQPSDLTKPDLITSDLEVDSFDEDYGKMVVGVEVNEGVSNS